MTTASPDHVLTCRQAGTADIDFLLCANRAVAQESESITLDSHLARQGIEGLMAHPDRGQYWVIWNERTQQPIGSCMITVEWSDWHACSYWWLQSVYIQPEYRGQGLWEHLLSSLENAAQEAGVRELRLYVDIDNKRAIRAYEKTQFETGHYQMMVKTIH